MSEKLRTKLDPSFWLSLFFVAVIARMGRNGRRLELGYATVPVGGWTYLLWLWPLRQLVADWKGAGAKAEQEEQERYPGILDIAVDRSIPPELMLRHTVKTAYWILTFVCGIWFLGFLISIPLFIFFYLISEAKARKLSALTVAGLTFLFVWALFDQMMHLAWPEAALFTLFR